jgi:hypothetical protein
MDAEQTIAEIEWLERIFAMPDTRPLSARDLSRLTKGTSKCSRIALGFHALASVRVSFTFSRTPTWLMKSGHSAQNPSSRRFLG